MNKKEEIKNKLNYEKREKANYYIPMSEVIVFLSNKGIRDINILNIKGILITESQMKKIKEGENDV